MSDCTIYDDRYRAVKTAFWWQVAIGDGQQTVGKYHSKAEAERTANALLTAFYDGMFVAQQQLAALNAHQIAYEAQAEQQLAEREKQIVMLREAIDSLVDFGTTVGGSSSYWEEVWPEKEAALDLTSDLSGLILCDAEPVAIYHGSDKGVEQFTVLEDMPEGTELYKAKEMK
jgi:hypothetical protein